MLLMTSGWTVGVPCGVIVGLVVALLLMTMIRTVADGVSLPDLVKLAPQFAAVPLLVFGGKWAAGAVVADVDWPSARPSYLFAVAAVDCIFVVPPMIRLSRGLVRA